MEEDSNALVRRLLPRHWVMHEYKPDYGIDYVVEVFDEVDGSSGLYQTAGETFYLQIKAVKSISTTVVEKFPRNNIEKSAFVSDKTSDPINIEVIKFQIDVRLINTVLLMGNAVPVLLFLCDLENDTVYFVCLNDYAEKILYPEKPTFVDQETVVLEIPKSNVLKNDSAEAIEIFRLFSKRSKFYAAFSKFFYQNHELQYVEDYSVLLRFLDIISKYDFWHKSSIWSPIRYIPQKIQITRKIINDLVEREATGGASLISLFDLGEWDANKDEFEYYFDSRNKIIQLWTDLANLGNMHEEIVREWFLPTYLAELCR